MNVGSWGTETDGGVVESKRWKSGRDRRTLLRTPLIRTPDPDPLPTFRGPWGIGDREGRVSVCQV